MNSLRKSSTLSSPLSIFFSKYYFALICVILATVLLGSQQASAEPLAESTETQMDEKRAGFHSQFAFAKRRMPSAFAFAKRDFGGRAFAFAKRSEAEAQSSEENASLPADKRFDSPYSRFAFAKRGPNRFAFAKRWPSAGRNFAFA
ncbi:hypothetical protein Ddc_04782 [Ditylenchus destructor]|nr:hypothetical protein Ddc_04782 [Ditylenchus destructor]